MLEFFLISYDFDSHDLSRLVIHALERLAKRAFAEKINNFKPIGNLVL
jgi:hypothetical protein